jgi:protein ImuB
LLRAGLGARHLDLFFERVDGHRQRSGSGPPCPRAIRRISAKLLCQRIDTIEPGLGVEAMMLVAPLTEPWPVRRLMRCRAARAGPARAD